MPAYKGPDTFRNPRKIALQKGTTPAGFDNQLIPASGPPDPTYPTAYRDPGEEVVMPAGVRPVLPSDPKPFKSGGGG